VDIVAVVFLISMGVWFWRQRRWPELTLTLISLVPLVTSTVYLSLARNSLTVFVVFLVLGHILVRARATIRMLIVVPAFVWMLGTTLSLGMHEWSG